MLSNSINIKNYHESIKLTNFIFIRHAESYNNSLYEIIFNKLGKNITEDVLIAEEIRLRQPDCGISSRGERQAQLLGEYIKENKLNLDLKNTQLFSSPMYRCLLTTNFLSNCNSDIKVTVNPLLYETGGCYDHTSTNETIGLKGLTTNEVIERFPSFTCMDGMENGWYKHSTVESSIDYHKRVDILVDWIYSLHNNNSTNQSFILVFHGNLLSSLLNRLMQSKSLIVHNNTGFSHVQIMSIEMNNRIERVSAVKSLNRVNHLIHDSTLFTGDDVIDDHWIQEYIDYNNI